MPSSANWRYVTYGDGKFVAVTYYSSRAAYSTNGISWTASTLPSSANWSSVTYGNGKFVAVASGPSTTAAYWSGTVASLYTITNSAIKINSAVIMYLENAHAVSSYNKENGSITVSMASAPITAIPYTLQIIETSTEGAFEIVNDYVTPEQVQSNWTESSITSKAFIQNKPTVDQAYNSSSSNAQSGTAVAEALRDSVAPVDLPATSKYVTGTIEISDWEAIAGSNEYSYTIVTSDIIGLNYLKVLRLSYKGTIYIYSTADNGRITLHLAATPTAAITYTLQIVETSEQGTVILINTARDVAGAYRRSIYSLAEAYRAHLTNTIDPRKTYIVKWAGASGVTDEKQFNYSTMVNISAATVNGYEGYQLIGAFFDIGNPNSPTTSYMRRVRCEYWYDTTVGASYHYLSAKKEDYKFSDGSLSFVDLYIYDVIEIG